VFVLTFGVFVQERQAVTVDRAGGFTQMRRATLLNSSKVLDTRYMHDGLLAWCRALAFAGKIISRNKVNGCKMAGAWFIPPCSK
jgi:hypothetical protein